MVPWSIVMFRNDTVRVPTFQTADFSAGIMEHSYSVASSVSRARLSRAHTRASMAPAVTLQVTSRDIETGASSSFTSKPAGKAGSMEPCHVESVDGNQPRVVFRRPPDVLAAERWQERRVRCPPQVPGLGTVRLSYFSNTKCPPNWARGTEWHSLAQVVLRDHGYERVEHIDDGWHIFWCTGQVQFDVLAQLRPGQKVNKFPKATSLTSKEALWQNLRYMQQVHGVEHYGFVPQSFVLPAELDAFAAHVESQLVEPPSLRPLRSQPAETTSLGSQRSQVDGEPDVWVLKPDDRSNGRGIFLLRPTYDFTLGRAQVRTDTQVCAHRGIASQYIDPPMLINQLKSDVRLYVLVTSFHPLVAYVYDEGLARFATEPYNLADIDKRMSHLTNYSLNKHSSKFQSSSAEGEGSKWSLAAYRARMVAELGEERAARAWGDVDDLIIKSLIAVEPVISEVCMCMSMCAFGRPPALLADLPLVVFAR